jgi:hypothetical protein
LFLFFTDVANLDAITPLRPLFRIVAPQPIAIRESALIDHRLRVRGLPLRWRTGSMTGSRSIALWTNSFAGRINFGFTSTHSSRATVAGWRATMCAMVCPWISRCIVGSCDQISNRFFNIAHRHWRHASRPHTRFNDDVLPPHFGKCDSFLKTWAARFRRLARDYDRLAITLAGCHWLAFALFRLKSLFTKSA